MTVEQWYKYLDNNFRIFKEAENAGSFLNTYNEAAGMVYNYPVQLLAVSTAMELLCKIKPKQMKYIEKNLPPLIKSKKFINGCTVKFVDKSLKAIAICVSSEESCYFKRWLEKKKTWNVMSLCFLLRLY